MGFYSRTQGKEIYIKRRPNGTGPQPPFYSQLCARLRSADFFCPFQLKHSTLSLSYKGIKLVGKVTSIFMCSPKNFVTRLCLYRVSRNSMSQVFTSVNLRTMAGTFYPRVVCSCPASIIAGLKHVGGGKQEIAFHTTGLGWTFQ